MEPSVEVPRDKNEDPNSSLGYLNDNMKSIKSLHFDPMYDETENKTSLSTKNHQMMNVSFAHSMFHGYPYKIEKIEERTTVRGNGSRITKKNENRKNGSNSSRSSSNDMIKNKQKIKKTKNVTSVIPFDRILENQILHNAISKQNIQHLVQHKNMYEERDSSVLLEGTNDYPFQIFKNIEQENANQRNTYNSSNHSLYTHNSNGTNLITNQQESTKNSKLMEVYDKEKNKKVIYYSVVNHYDPNKSKEEEEERKTERKYNDLYNKNVYESDIYDYLLNQYERNYKKLVYQLTSSTNPSKMNSIENNQTDEKQPINTKLKKQGSEVDSNKPIKERKYNKTNNETEKKCKLNEKIKEIIVDSIENAEKESCTTFMNHRKNSIESLNEKEKKFNSKLHNPSLYIEDSLDIFKDMGDIHTKKPKLLVRSSKNSSHEPILKINKDTKKILKKLKSKNTVIISNIGRKCGSSTFSNYIINNDQIHNFTKDVHNTGECVYSYITTNHNKINYMYLDFDKMRKKTQVEEHPNKFMNLSFYLSNIIIFHIDETNYLDMFYLLSDYYIIIKKIRENIRQRRKKWKEGKKQKQHKQRKNTNHVPIFNHNEIQMDETSMELIEETPTESITSKSNDLIEKEPEEEEIEDESEEEETEEPEEEESFFDENKLNIPYFIFLLRDFNNGTTKEKTKEEGKRGNLPDKNYTTAEGHLNALIYNIYDANLKKRIQYVMKYVIKKHIMYLPSLYKNKSQTIINYDYMYALKNIKKELFIQSKGIDNMYRNNGVYIYKYLSMVVYTINNHVYYSSDHLKKKIENFENRMLQDVLTENLLVNIRRKMEKKLPLKIDYLLTLTNELKLEFILTYEKFAIGSETTKKKYKQDLSKRIDQIILKTYKENLAYSYYAFFNEINKRIEELKIQSKIDNKTYQSFEELVRELQSINEKNNDNFVYNEILNKKKEEIITTFVNSYYHNQNGTVKNITEERINNKSIKNEINQNEWESNHDPLYTTENGKITKTEHYFLNALNHDYSNSHSETSSYHKPDEQLHHGRKKYRNGSEEYVRNKKVSMNDSLLDYSKGNYDSDKKEKQLRKSISYRTKSKTKRNSFFGDSENSEDQESDTNHFDKRHMNKYKSEKYLYDMKKNMEKKESKLPRKYKSLDYAYGKSKIDIYKKLMKDVHSDSSDTVCQKRENTQGEYSMKWKQDHKETKYTNNIQSSETTETISEHVEGKQQYAQQQQHSYHQSITDVKNKKKSKKMGCFRRKGKCSVM